MQKGPLDNFFKPKNDCSHSKILAATNDIVGRIICRKCFKELDRWTIQKNQKGGIPNFEEEMLKQKYVFGKSKGFNYIVKHDYR